MHFLQVIVPAETAFALEKLGKFAKCLERSLTPMHLGVAMPNQPAPDKVILAIRITRALKRRLEKLAALRKESVTDVVIAILNQQVQSVELTPDDYRKIADEIEKARAGGIPDQRLRPRRTQGGARP